MGMGMGGGAVSVRPNASRWYQIFAVSRQQAAAAANGKWPIFSPIPLLADQAATTSHAHSSHLSHTHEHEYLSDVSHMEWAVYLLSFM
jgi:hypothetical protein